MDQLKKCKVCPLSLFEKVPKPSCYLVFYLHKISIPKIEIVLKFHVKKDIKSQTSYLQVVWNVKLKLNVGIEKGLDNKHPINNYDLSEFCPKKCRLSMCLLM